MRETRAYTHKNTHTPSPAVLALVGPALPPPVLLRFSACTASQPAAKAAATVSSSRFTACFTVDRSQGVSVGMGEGPSSRVCTEGGRSTTCVHTYAHSHEALEAQT